MASIGSLAFESCIALLSIVIPRSVTYIGESAFYGCNLCGESASDDDDAGGGVYMFAKLQDMTVVPSYTFYHPRDHCNNLVSVNISDSVTTIRSLGISFALLLDNVIIPNSVTLIDSLAFQGCIALVTIQIPPSATTVHPNAFLGCGCAASLYVTGAALQNCVRGFLNQSRQWVPYTNCTHQQYQRHAGSFTTDVQCNALTVCMASQYTSVDATVTSDRSCAGRAHQLDTWDKVGIAMAVLVFVALAISVGVYLQSKRRRSEKDLHLHTLLLQDERAEKQTLYAENIEMKRAWEIQEIDLMMERELASGAFGSVWRAKWGHIDVAVKVLKHVDGSELDSMAGEDFNREVSFMQKSGTRISSSSTEPASRQPTLRSWCLSSWSKGPCAPCCCRCVRSV